MIRAFSPRIGVGMRTWGFTPGYYEGRACGAQGVGAAVAESGGKRRAHTQVCPEGASRQVLRTVVPPAPSRSGVHQKPLPERPRWARVRAAE